MSNQSVTNKNIFFSDIDGVVEHRLIVENTDFDFIGFDPKPTQPEFSECHVNGVKIRFDSQYQLDSEGRFKYINPSYPLLKGFILNLKYKYK